MAYDFSQLSYADFEDLSRDLIGVEEQIRFEAFGPGPDGGVDGRHSKGNTTTVLQAKHYGGSSFSSLLSAIKKERNKLDVLAPDRYFLTTSRALNPKNKAALATELGPHLRAQSDIFGNTELNELLRKHPKIEKSHFKLWLASSAVLDRLIHSGIEQFTQTTKTEIETKLKTYVPNPSLNEAQKLLNRYHVLIVSGPPGVGKTTLAEIIVFLLMNENWELVSIQDLSEGFARLNDAQPTVFFFDDFLGRVKLNEQALLEKDSALAKFADRVRRTKNARFILTTRAHIFEVARTISDYIDSDKLQLSKYVLDVGQYTRRVKARILFNHLSVSNFSDEHFEYLFQEDHLPTIIDHKNYNPRIITSVSSDVLDSTIPPADYPQLIRSALDKPDKIWEKPFRALAPKCQHLLIVLFFSSEYGVEIADLKKQFFPLHDKLSAYYSIPVDPKDFEDSLKTLETGFIQISGTSVRFVNPSLKDYLTVYLNDEQLLFRLPETAVTARWAATFWQYCKEMLGENVSILEKLALSFKSFALRLPILPIWERVAGKPTFVHQVDNSQSDRIELLLEWWDVAQEEDFVSAIKILASSKPEKFNDSRDATNLPSLIERFRDLEDSTYPDPDKIVESLTEKLIQALDGGISPDDLVTIGERVDEYLFGETSPLSDAVVQAMDAEIEGVSSVVNEFDSESDLADYAEKIKEIGNFLQRNVDDEVGTIHSRMHEIENSYTDYEPSESYTPRRENSDKFSDDELFSLFSTLRQSD